MEESMIDTKTAKAALFPNLSFSTSHNVVNRPYSEQSSIIDGSNVISTSHKTNYNGNYGLNASWTLYNGSKRLNIYRRPTEARLEPDEPEIYGGTTPCQSFHAGTPFFHRAQG